MFSRRLKIFLVVLFFLFVLIGNPFFHNHSPKLTDSPTCPVYLLNLVLSGAFLAFTLFLIFLNIPHFTPLNPFEKAIAPQPIFSNRLNRAPPQK